jgi:uncharacterized cupin superfamily protein
VRRGDWRNEIAGFDEYADRTANHSVGGRRKYPAIWHRIDMKVMIAAAQTGGTCSVLIGELKPGDGPPPHLHRDHDEYFFVLESTISLVVPRP